MVEKNGPDLKDNIPEVKLAIYLRKKFKLHPGFEIKSFANEFFDIEEDVFPFSADAVFIEKESSNQKPVVLLNSQMPVQRRRFTLAHELAHYFISWHFGTIVCHIDTNDSYRYYLFREMEAEANRFASELIMPCSWIESLFSYHTNNLQNVLTNIIETGVSVIAANFALCKCLPEGYVFVQTDYNNFVQYSGISFNTQVSPPEKDTFFHPELFLSLSASNYILEYPTYKTYWFFFSKEMHTQETSDNNVDSCEYLINILAKIEPSPQKRPRLLCQINGVIGSANGKNYRNKNELFSILIQRFASKIDLRHLLDEPCFKIFLDIKSQELADKKHDF